MIIYLDSSAILKRVLDEPESERFEDALGTWAANDKLGTSALSVVEVSRSLRARLDTGLDIRQMPATLDSALADLPQHPIDAEVLALARVLGPARLRSLDAIHLATAVLLQADLLVSYDERLTAVAEELGVPTASPGRR